MEGCTGGPDIVRIAQYCADLPGHIARSESVRMQLHCLLHLQAKLVKYRQEALEGGELMEQLTSQAKSDQQIIRDLQEYAEAGQQELTTVKVIS